MDDIKIKNKYGDEIGRIEIVPDIFPSVVGVILMIIAILAAILVPFLVLRLMIADISAGEMGAIMTLLLSAATVAAHTKIILKKEMYYSFWETWGMLIGSSTVVISVICWIEALVKSKMEFGYIFLIPFTAAICSSFPALVGSLVYLIMEIKKNRKGKTP